WDDRQADGVLPPLLEGLLDPDGLWQRTILAAAAIGGGAFGGADGLSGDIHVHARGRAGTDRVIRIPHARCICGPHLSIPNSRVREVPVREELAVEFDAGLDDARA